jgi:tungstate transport system ATP-binding protein
MSENVIVAITGLVKEYRHRRVLDIPSIAILSGKAVALTGHNGSGKTTLLRIVAGLEQPTTGSVAVRARIGFCAQKPYMFRGTVWDNLVWGRENADPGPARELAKRLQLDALLERPAKQCSAGEMQKVSLGRMLIRNPELLLLDEPTANLDGQARDTVEAAIETFVAQGGACVMATHMADHAHRFSAGIVRLEQGRVTHAEVDNVFEGTIVRQGESTLIRVSDRVSIFCAEAAAPGRRRFCIAAMELVLSLSPLESSMRNSFAGVVTGLRAVNGAVEATVDVGIPLRSLLTRESLARLSLSIGSPVVVSFKAVAVRLL